MEGGKKTLRDKMVENHLALFLDCQNKYGNVFIYLFTYLNMDFEGGALAAEESEARWAELVKWGHSPMTSALMSWIEDRCSEP